MCNTRILVGITAVLIGAVGGALADPVVPGFTVETYAANAPNLLDTLSFDSSGNLYVGNDVSWGKIYKVPPGGGAFQEYGDTTLPDPDAVIVDLTGAISGVPDAVLVGGLIDVQYEGYVVAIWPDQTTHDIWPQTSAFGNPNDFAFDHNGRLLFSDIAVPPRVLVYDPSTDPGGPPPTVEPTDLISDGYVPSRVAISTQGWIFASTACGTIRVYDSDGTLLSSFVSFPWGYCIDPGI